jgi:hypothetical protein
MIDFYRWPWALIEAALQVHSSLDNPSFWEASEMFMLMKIFSGDNEVRDKPKPSDQEGELPESHPKARKN